MPENYDEMYRRTFAGLGRPLRRGDGVAASRLAAGEKRLGVPLPRALRAFYAVAGRASDFNNRHDQLLPPTEWSLEGGKLVFLVENQEAVLYGVDVRRRAADPPVLMASNAEPYVWQEVCSSCSEFFAVIAHWNGAFGGAMKTGGSVRVQPSMRRRLERRLTLVGEVNRMWAFSGEGLSVCLLRWNDGWRIFAGAADEATLEAFAQGCGVTFHAA